MKNQFTIPVMVSTAVLLASCGGGGGSSNSLSAPAQSKPSYNLTGTVPGTLIEAFCDDGSYYSTKSTKNGTTKHPFSLKLPTDLSCRLVMTTNEDDPNNKVVTAIKFINKDGASSIAFSSDKDIDIKHIDLAISRSQMLSDANQDGVEDLPKEIILDDTISSKIKVIISKIDKLDADNDGIINVYEDDDGDKVPNRDDLDDDGDGILDIEDNDQNNDGKPDNDSDSDGITNDIDKDDDNDGKSDDVDSDDDNDGISDKNDIDHPSNNTAADSDKGKDSDDDSKKKDDDKDDDHDNGNGGPVTPPTTPNDPVVTTPTAGRLLASQCAQCHGTDGYSVTGIDSLAGESRGEIIGEMREMKNKNKNKLMHLQAKGYTAEQVSLIADYFSGVSGGGNNNGNGNDEDDD